MSGGTISTMLVEDHQIVREGLRSLLRGEKDIVVVGEAAEGNAAYCLAEKLRPDVVVMDVSIPGPGGIDVTRRIKKSLPDTQVVMLSIHEDAPTVDRALRAGARGYVLKGRGVACLCEAIRAVARGETYLCPELSEYVLPGFLGGRGAERDLLSDREREVLKLIADGNTSRRVAEILDLSPKTVDNHRARIMEKLGIHTTAGLVRYAIHAGIAK
ncbi:MAG: response regulator transcription factor [Deltaproteobacteria bacterium]|nr:response regulator transcription factor [Deltaproteobacteria bacterium]